MAKKPNGRLLLTWNKKKHPEVVEFFNNIEEGLYSHSVRKAIEFYMKYNGKIKESSSGAPSHSFESDLEGAEDRSASTNDNREDESSEYTNFDVDEL